MMQISNSRTATLLDIDMLVRQCTPRTLALSFRKAKEPEERASKTSRKL